MMANVYFILAFVLLIAWGIGFLGYQGNDFIHILLVIAIVSIFLNIIKRKRKI